MTDDQSEGSSLQTSTRPRMHNQTHKLFETSATSVAILPINMDWTLYTL